MVRADPLVRRSLTPYPRKTILGFRRPEHFAWIMPDNIPRLRVFIASSSELVEERQRIVDVLKELTYDDPTLQYGPSVFCNAAFPRRLYSACDRFCPP